MVIFLYFIFWFIGVLVTSFTLIPVLIILVFAIPTTLKLDKLKLLKVNNGIVKRYLVSLTLLTLIFLVMIIITFNVYPKGLIGLLFGGGMAFIFGIGRIGRNEDNIIDYIQLNKERFFVTAEKVKDVILGL